MTGLVLYLLNLFELKLFSIFFWHPILTIDTKCYFVNAKFIAAFQLDNLTSLWNETSSHYSCQLHNRTG